MNIIIWLIVGGIIGWLASLVTKTDEQQGINLNIVAGIVGALIGGWLLSPLLAAGSVNHGDFGLKGMLVSFGCAFILLLIIDLFRRGAPS
ncbi:MAG TPA: GlsB/YeaQ/YmgE family stress response membrane protein [Halioglobus sp.]